MSLSTNQIHHFQKMRYLKVPGVFEHKTINAAKRQLKQDMVTQPNGMRKQGGKLYGLHARGGEYHNLMFSSTLLEIIADLIGENIVYTINRHNIGNLYLPGENPYRFHRDMLRQNHLTVIVYLDDSTVENGPTEIIPGSHEWAHVPESEGGMWLDATNCPYTDLTDQAVIITAQSGDVLLFDSSLYHTAGENVSSTTRATLIFGYQAVDELTGVIEPQQILAFGKDLYRGNCSLDSL